MMTLLYYYQRSSINIGVYNVKIIFYIWVVPGCAFISTYY